MAARLVRIGFGSTDEKQLCASRIAVVQHKLFRSAADKPSWCVVEKLTASTVPAVERSMTGTNSFLEMTMLNLLPRMCAIILQ